MSGGSLNYFYSHLEEHSGDFGDKELDELVKDLAELFREREWYLSGDIGIGPWREARDEFKTKWFTPHGRQDRIEKYLSEVGDEIRESFGMQEKRCGSCSHWKSDDKLVYYGRCEFEEGCLTHRSDGCAKCNPREEKQSKRGTGE